MSNRTRLFSKEDGTSFWQDIKAFFAGIPPYILSLLQDLSELVDPVIDQAVEIATAFGVAIEKGSIGGNIADAIVNATPFNFDNQFLEWWRENGTNIIQIIAGIPDDIDNIEDALEDFFNQVQGFSPQLQNGVKLKIASETARQYANSQLGKSLTESDADYMVQTFYVDSRKGQNV